jgi:hypothetical protein
MADGKFQAAADEVVKLANAKRLQGKHWTDPFIPACDLKSACRPTGELRKL